MMNVTILMNVTIRTVKIQKRKEAVYFSGPIVQYAGTLTEKALPWFCYSRNKNGVQEEMKTVQAKQATQGERQREKACQNAGQSNKACCTKLIYRRADPSAFCTGMPLAPEGVLPCKIFAECPWAGSQKSH